MYLGQKPFLANRVLMDRDACLQTAVLCATLNAAGSVLHQNEIEYRRNRAPTRSSSARSAPAPQESLSLARQFPDNLAGRLYRRDAVDRFTGPVRHGLNRTGHTCVDAERREALNRAALARMRIHVLAHDFALLVRFGRRNACT